MSHLYKWSGLMCNKQSMVHPRAVDLGIGAEAVIKVFVERIMYDQGAVRFVCVCVSFLWK